MPTSRLKYPCRAASKLCRSRHASALGRCRVAARRRRAGGPGGRRGKAETGRRERHEVNPRAGVFRTWPFPALARPARLTWVKPEHLPLLNSVSAPPSTPTAHAPLCPSYRPDFDADSYVGQLWSVPQDPEKLPRPRDPRLPRHGTGFFAGRPRPGFPPRRPWRQAPAPRGGGRWRGAAGPDRQNWACQLLRLVTGFRTASCSVQGSRRRAVTERSTASASGGEDARLITGLQVPDERRGLHPGQAAAAFPAGCSGAGRGARRSSQRDAPPSAATVRQPERRRGELRRSRRGPAASRTHGSSRRRQPTTPARPSAATAAPFTSWQPFTRMPTRTWSSGIYRVAADGGDTGFGAGPQRWAAQTVSDVRESAGRALAVLHWPGPGQHRQDFVAKNTVLLRHAHGGRRGAGAERRGEHGRRSAGRPHRPPRKDSALVLNNAQGTVELLEFSATGRPLPPRPR